MTDSPSTSNDGLPQEVNKCYQALGEAQGACQFALKKGKANSDITQFLNSSGQVAPVHLYRLTSEQVKIRGV